MENEDPGLPCEGKMELPDQKCRLDPTDRNGDESCSVSEKQEEVPAAPNNGPMSVVIDKVNGQEELREAPEDLSDKDVSDSTSTDNTWEDSSEFRRQMVIGDGPSGEEEAVIQSRLATYRDEDVTAESWRAHRKHVFILNDHKLVFVQQGPLVLVSVSHTLQSEQQLRQELLYVYDQIISMLTQASITRIFERKKNYDLRRLLTGSEKILDRLLNLVESDPCFLLGAVRCLPLAASLRDSLGTLLQKAITPNLVFSILVAGSQLVTTVQEKTVIEDCRLEPTDLHLLLNLIGATSAFQTGEIWTPICLPRFNPDCYFYAYISYLDSECTVCLILLSTDKDSFYSVSDCKKRIEEGMRTQNYLQALSSGLKSPSYSVGLVGVPDLRHFMYKPLDIPDNYRQLPQFTSPELEGPYCSENERHRLFDLYHYLHDRIHSTSRPLRLIYHVAEKETLLAWVTSKFELYTCFNPLVTKAGAINVLTKLLRWIKKEEDRLFIRYPLKYSTTPNPGKGSRVPRMDGTENGFFGGGH
ncbi:vacuolar fusion protein MON1 homolog B isoform X2 [Ahaetulla prasina]|uniref:vacuolar fusion protein MON1 homolog B isoform X2 n=1 Tax=Ahaetulla prasina TaxID=499056 RepID=UPI00264719F6|nr:vacuolar fusion protein MON1 homolog B isoform X2 [Ahaetulla prasina]